MRKGLLAVSVRALLAGAAIEVGGCAYLVRVESNPRDDLPRQLRRESVAAKPAPAASSPRSTIVPASHAEPAPVLERAGIDDLVALAVARNPRLAKATFAIDAARGRHIQAGLYPNPELAINWDEIGDRTGQGGVLAIPLLTQKVITGRKLTLSQAVVAAEIDQATIALFGERYAVIAGVREAYYDAYALERRIAVLDELVKVIDEAVKNVTNMVENQKMARLDLVQLQAEREKVWADAEAAKRELPSARRALAAAVGDPRLAIGSLSGPIEDLPRYDADRGLELVLATHPQVRSAQIGAERAQAALRRARADVIPDVTIYTGFIKQYENRSNDFAAGVSTPVPVWNRNQGNIRAAQAELSSAMMEVARVENELTDKFATAFRAYAAARRKAELYRTSILPKLRESADLSLKAFQGGQFDILRLALAQRALAEAKVDYVKTLTEVWKGAAQLSGLLLEEAWPEPPREPAPGTIPDPADR
jgi:cobalt-zinc-cadmium efflux system outer membrane protein